MSRMVGAVAYADVWPLLRRANAAWPMMDWLECRSHLLARPADLYQPGLNPEEQALARAWMLDDCPKASGSKYARYFWDLDSWTEYWDIYRPETRGQYYFGDGERDGYLTEFLPTPQWTRNPVFDSWKTLAVCSDGAPNPVLLERFQAEARRPRVVEAVLAVDELVLRLVRFHFEAASGKVDQLAYLDAMERFGKNTLPECPDRFERLPADDPRKRSALHHSMEGDVMWFAWATHLECAQMVAPHNPESDALRRLLMAGVVLGCSFDFAFRGERRTRREYASADAAAWTRIWSRARECTLDFELAANEARQLFRIREFGDE